jgi:hypothetical protein
VIVQLPTIAATGAATASGFLVFGIGTQSNNGLGSATVLTTDGSGDINASLNGVALADGGFLDSGSNGLFFPDSSIPLCTGSAGAMMFYCPTATLNLTATIQGQNGNSADFPFSVANLNSLSSAEFALDDVAGPAGAIMGVGSNYFDFGLPFFYGRTVFSAIQGADAGGTMGPYNAY